VFSVADTVSKADGGTFDGNVTMGGTLGVTGDATFDTSTLKVDSSNNRVGIGTASPDSLLTVQSSGATTAKIDTSSTSSYAELLLEDGNAGYAFQTRSDNAQSTGTGSLVLNDRDSSSFPIVIKEGNPTNSFVMSNNGCVTMANQPAFLVRATQQDNIANGTTMTFGTEIFDQNGDFASNAFTAPVTGRYHLSFSIRLVDLDNAASYIIVRMETSNRNLDTIIDIDEFSSDVQYYTANYSMLMDMDANDTASVVYVQSGGSSVVDMDATHSLFSGYLVA